MNPLNQINYSDLKNKLNNIPNVQHRTTLKTIYACCARVGEITNPKYTTYKGKAIMGRDVSYTDTSLYFNVLTEKRNTPRKIPVARIDCPEHEFFKRNESWLTEDIISYVSNFDSDSKLFDRSTRWAEYVFQTYFSEFGQHIHLLRHWRATHLLSGQATGKPVPMSVVAKIGGWKGTSTLSNVYDNTIIEDYWGI
jgi:integrase